MIIPVINLETTTLCYGMRKTAMHANPMTAICNRLMLTANINTTIPITVRCPMQYMLKWLLTPFWRKQPLCVVVAQGFRLN
jgi:hypothetical protein